MLSNTNRSNLCPLFHHSFDKPNPFDIFDGKTLKDLDPFNITSDFGGDIPLDANFAWLLFLLLMSLVWVTYCIYYNSRVLGYIVTLVLNHLIIPRYFDGGRKGKGKRCDPICVTIGSLSVSFISGKLMFRDVMFANSDYSMRVQDGFTIFRWWLPYAPKDVRRTDLSHSDTRLQIVLNGAELHIYNRSQLYHRLEKLFNLPSRLFGGTGDDGGHQDGDESAVSETDRILNQTGLSGDLNLTNDDLIKAYLWRDLIPLTKIEVSTGRFVFGNHHTPSTLTVTFEEAAITYTSRPALSPHDLFTHIAKFKVESFKVILVPSPKFLGLTDEPPRYMGEGFVVFQSNHVDFYYYQDEPGLVSLEPEKIELPTGDVVERFTSPAWGCDVKCGKGTDFSYGPWADRQREFLYNFFFPPDYQRSQVVGQRKLGDLRTFETFDFRLSTLADATIDVLFVKNRETSAVHVNAGPGSYLEITIPWVTKSATGYETHILGQILHLDATTSLTFRSLVECETLEFDVRIKYPMTWNGHQEWLVDMIGSKATVSLVFAHKWFFCDLIDDWAGKGRPDILSFVPYTVKFGLVLKEFELIVNANEHNWIDCSSNSPNDNVQLAIIGDTFDISFDLPFTDFLPPTVPIKIWIQGESLEAAFYLPDANVQRDIVDIIDATAKLRPFVGLVGGQHPDAAAEMPAVVSVSDLFPVGKKWRNVAKKELGWTTCWSVPIVAISINFTYHPSPPLSAAPRDAEVTTPEREELLLEPMKPDHVSAFTAKRSQAPVGFDPGQMVPDTVHVELEVGPSTLCLYGVLLRMLWDIKENYLGECQMFTDFAASPETSLKSSGAATGSEQVHEKLMSSVVSFALPLNGAGHAGQQPLKPFDARLYRPLNVTVSVTMHGE